MAETERQAQNRAVAPLLDTISGTAPRPIWCDSCGVPRSYHPSREEWLAMCRHVDVSSLGSPCRVAEVRYEAKDHAS